MACYLFKLVDGEVVKEEVNAHDVSNLLSRGYKSTEEELTEHDLNEDGAIDNSEVRQAAKDAGIDNWKTARIATLIGALGYDNKD